MVDPHARARWSRSQTLVRRARSLVSAGGVDLRAAAISYESGQLSLKSAISLELRRMLEESHLESSF